MGLNTSESESEHRGDAGSDASNNPRPAPSRSRALTVTSNDNPRATKRRANDSTRDEAHTHTSVPHYNALVTPAPHSYERGRGSSHATYGHPQAQSLAGTVSSAQMRQGFSSATGGHSVRSAYGYTQGHTLEHARVQPNAMEVFQNANTKIVERLTYGHTQGHGPEPTRVHTDTPTSNTYVTAPQTETWSLDHSLHMGHGHTRTRPSEPINLPPPAPTPFRTTGSNYSVLPPLRPSNPAFPHQLPPIRTALANPVAPSNLDMHYSTSQLTGPVLEPPRAPMSPTNIANTIHNSGHTQATSTAATVVTSITPRHPSNTQQTSAHVPTPSGLARSQAPGPAPHTSPMPPTHPAPGSTRPRPRPRPRPQPPPSAASDAPHPTAPTKHEPTNMPSGSSAHLPRTPKPARSPSPPIIISSSPTSDVWTACDNSRTPVKPKVEQDGDDEVVEYNPFDGEGSEGSTGDEGDTIVDDEEKKWVATHPPSRYPGGPRLVRANTRIKTFTNLEAPFRKHVRVWEEGYIIEEFCHYDSSRDWLWEALKSPQQTSGKYHKLIRSPSKNTFMGARNEKKVYSMLCGIVATYKQCRLLTKLIGPCDFKRPDDVLINEISPLIAQHKSVHKTLDKLTAWRFICYNIGGDDSWYTRLHAHLFEHPKHADIEMHNGRLSPAPARSGRGSGRGRGRGSRGGAPRGPALQKGKGKAAALSDGTKPALSSVAPSNNPTPTSVVRSGPSTRGDPLSASRKPVPTRSSDRATSTVPKRRSATPQNPSPAAAIDAIRKTHDSRLELSDRVVGLKKQSEVARIGLLTRKLEHNEHFQEEAHRLEVARLALERARTEATFNAERQKEHLAFLLSIRDRGKEAGKTDPLYDEAVRLLQQAIQAGVTLFHVPNVVASLSDPAPAPTSRPTTTVSRAPPTRLQTAGAGPSTGPGTSQPRPTGTQSANRLSPDIPSPIDAEDFDSEDDCKRAGWHGGWSQSKKYYGRE
ncbi:hypothetical protein FRC08_005919 [Ceratobasidium sp. 394]|nr:hypothetical protein FRC08_005919 [Ceratobasidium sp. 394]